MKKRPYRLFQTFCSWVNLPGYFVISILLLFITFLIFDWFAAISLRAAKIDHYILFSMAETSRFYYAQTAHHNLFVFLNPNAKPVYSVISSIFLFLFPLGLFSLKLLNSLLSVSILVVLYKLMKRMGFGDFVAAIAVMLTVTFPLFFLLSIAALSEILFCFFLVIGFYYFYLKKYFVSSLLISLLPLIRQEGALYICIMLFFLLKEKKAHYAFILPVPLLIWVLLNFFLLNHSVIYPFFVSIDLPGPTPKGGIMSLAEFKNFIPGIFYHPLFFLFPFGFMLMAIKKHSLPILMALTCHGLFIIIALVTQFLIIKQVSYDFRYIVPLVPFMALVTAGIFDRLILGARTKIIVLVFIFISLTGILVNRIIAFQKHPRVVAESITEKQEIVIEEAVIWLKDYIKESGSHSVFYSGDLTGDKIIRRLKVYLASNVALYPVKEFREVYDPVTFKIIENDFCNSSLSGIVLLIDPEREKVLISGKETKFIKSFPDISVYLYRK